jgi:rod shape-determining protein MreD
MRCWSSSGRRSSCCAVVYWSLNAPRAGGIALGFLTGLALDVFKGAVLGQYALATSLVAYVTIRQHLMMRNKPVFEQTLFVALMLLLWEIVVWAIDGWTGQNSIGSRPLGARAGVGRALLAADHAGARPHAFQAR